MLKFLYWNLTDTLIFLAEKMWVAFALQKLLTFLQQTNINVFENTLATIVKDFAINKLIKLIWTTKAYRLSRISAHDILKYFSSFSQKIGFAICELSPKETIAWNI